MRFKPARHTARAAVAAPLAAMLLLSACGGTEEAAPEPAPVEPAPAEPAPEVETVDGLAEVCAAGAEEGSFSYWATFADENFAQIEAVFAATYPGIDVEFLALRSDEIVQRVVAASAAGQDIEVDLANGDLDELKAMYDRGLTDTDIDWSALGVADDIIHSTNMVRIYRVPLGLAYNSSLSTPDDLPDTWFELASEEYRGEFIVDPRGNPFSQLSLHWGAEETLAYVERLKEFDPVVIRGGTAGMLEVVAGNYLTTTGGRDDSRAELQADGAPIEIKYLDVIPTTDFYNVLFKDSPSSNAAACFAGWLMTEEGQAIHTEVEFKANESIPPSAPAGATIVSIESGEDADAAAEVAEAASAIWTTEG